MGLFGAIPFPHSEQVHPRPSVDSDKALVNPCMENDDFMCRETELLVRDFVRVAF